MKTKLMKTMANAILIPTALAISTLIAQAQKLDRPVALSASLDRYVAADVLDVDVIKNADVPAGVKVIDGVEEIELINLIEPSIALDDVRGGVLVDAVENEIDHTQAIADLDIARTIDY